MFNSLRTPDSRFENLSGYSFEPNYAGDLAGYEDLRMHYLDEGDKDSEHTFLCLHGEPTWSYLYRKMIPIFVQGGGRVIAPDHFGFGKSDKPTDDNVYSFEFHRNALIQLIQKLDLKNITLVCQDWGGLLGLTIPMDMSERFSRLIIMNTSFGIGKVNKAFFEWRAFNQSNPDLQIGTLMRTWEPCVSEEEAKAYDAPFPSQEYKAGVRTFPNLVPDNPEAPGASLSMKALMWWKNEWKGKSFMAIGMKDPILGPEVMNLIRSVIPGCPKPLEIADAGHFVQEHGELIAEKALDSFAAS